MHCSMDVKNQDQIAGELIRTKREEKRLTQQELARRIGTNQQTIGKIEKGTTKHSSYLPAIGMELDIPLDTLIPSLPKSASNGVIPGTELVGNRDLPVHAAVEGGRGALILSTDPVDWVARPEPLARVKDGYGIIVIEESMAPEFRPGDIALVNPHLPAVAGATCVFFSEQDDGTIHASIKYVRKVTPEAWHVSQWNPKKDFQLKRAEWQKCHVTVGKYSKR